ncbi:MAG: (2Fe-2S) ferredoxin domain-containing protein [Phycisphaeraceae bacterium]|nr:(2Fe-2S) ferredoxin domain-containing protein [Phycisphaeraceae bacterium]
MAIKKPDIHILVCASFRTTGEPKGVCHRKGSTDLLSYLENEILDRGLNAQVTSTGCFKLCDKGPVMVVHPGNHWYGEIDEEKIDQILDKLEENQPAAELLLT